MPGNSRAVSSRLAQTTTGINITTNNVINLSNFGVLTNIGFINSPAGRTYAVAFPASQIAAINPGADLFIQAGRFTTAVVDSSVPPIFAQAVLTTGVINSDGTASIDLVNPLRKTTGFLGQDLDFAPFFFSDPAALGKQVRDGINAGTIQNLFLVLQIPTTTPFPGVSGQPPLIGLSSVAPIQGLSFLSNDGGVTFNRITNFNFVFSLQTSAF
jgi:hypothetical protein